MKRKLKKLGRLGAVCLVGGLHLACGDPVEPKKPAPTRVQAQPELTPFEVWDGSSGGPGLRGVRSVSERVAVLAELRFTVEVRGTRFELGAELPARLEIENVSDQAIRILDPRKSLPADLHFMVQTPDLRTVTIKEHKEIRRHSISSEDIITIAPGGRESTIFDLAPTLAAAGRGMRGQYRIRTTFTGGHQGGHLAVDVWNRSRGKSIDAPIVTLTLEWPAGLSDIGVTAEDSARLATLLSRVGSDGLPPPSAVRELGAMGDALYPALMLQLAGAAAPRPEEQLIGWTAFHLLRKIGEPALVSLARSPAVAQSPMGNMLGSLISSDLQREASHEPSSLDSQFLYRLMDPERRVNVLFRMTRVGNAKTPGDVFTIFGDGRLIYAHDGDPDDDAQRAALQEKHLARFFKVLAKERVWLQRAVRQAGVAGETRLVLELLTVADGEVSDTPLWRIEVWETEAFRFNRSLANVIAALGDVRLAMQE